MYRPFLSPSHMEDENNWCGVCPLDCFQHISILHKKYCKALFPEVINANKPATMIHIAYWFSSCFLLPTQINIKLMNNKITPIIAPVIIPIIIPNCCRLLFYTLSQTSIIAFFIIIILPRLSFSCTFIVDTNHHFFLTHFLHIY